MVVSNHIKKTISLMKISNKHFPSPSNNRDTTWDYYFIYTPPDKYDY